MPKSVYPESRSAGVEYKKANKGEEHGGDQIMHTVCTASVARDCHKIEFFEREKPRLKSRFFYFTHRATVLG